MANAVRTKLQRISGQYSAKVKDIRDLKADLRKPFVTDAEAKIINTKIKKLDSERLQINAELDRLTKLAKTAEEYIDLNEELKTLESSIAKADARGESTVSFKQKRNAAVTRLKSISSDVERSFPEIKVTPPKVSTEGVTGPDAARAGLKTPSTPKPGVKPETVTKTPTTDTGKDIKPAGDKDISNEGANTSAFPQYSGVDTTTAAGIAAASARPPVAGAKTSLDTLLAKTDFWYDLPDYIFKLDPKLGELLVEAVAGGWDNEKFLASAKLTPWWQKNSSTVRTRIVDRAKYNELKAAGEDVTKSDYGLYLSKQVRSVKAKAKEIAGVTLTDEQAQSIAGKIYDGFLDDDPLAINALITPFIGKTTSIVGTGVGGKQTGFGGQALQNYQTLQGIAKANGFSLKDILPNVSAITAGGDLETAVLQGLANGDIDINRVAQDARMLAAQGQPKYVRDLLGQGYDLEAVYAPYRRTMASELELQPDEIDLNDSTLRMAITDKGDMNLYDFKKALRQDNRWQYTGTAKEEVSNAALKVLQDFGFQG
jgi:hypothetical protein